MLEGGVRILDSGADALYHVRQMCVFPNVLEPAEDVTLLLDPKPALVAAKVRKEDSVARLLKATP